MFKTSNIFARVALISQRNARLSWLVTCLLTECPPCNSEDKRSGIFNISIGVELVLACSWLCHKLSCKWPSLFSRHAVTFPAKNHHYILAKLYCFVTEEYMCEQVARSHYILWKSVESNQQSANLKSNVILLVFWQHNTTTTCTNLGKILGHSIGQQGGWMGEGRCRLFPPNCHQGLVGAERQATMKVWVVTAGKLPKF